MTKADADKIHDELAKSGGFFGCITQRAADIRIKTMGVIKPAESCIRNMSKRQDLPADVRADLASISEQLGELFEAAFLLNSYHSDNKAHRDAALAYFNSVLPTAQIEEAA